MKVLHVMNGAGGGAAMSVIALMHALRARGIASCAVCHDAGSAEEKAAVSAAAGGAVLFTQLYFWNRKIRADAWKRPLLELRQLARTGMLVASTARVLAFARAQRADLVHTSTMITPDGALAARLGGLPHVWHVRELIGPGHPFRLPIEGRALGLLLASASRRMIANSNASADALRPWLPEPERLDVVPNGVDLAGFSPAPRAAGARVVVGMVGNLTSRTKKHGLVIDAMARLGALPLELRIYGHDAPGDAYAAGLRAQVARAGLVDRVSFRGFIGDPARIMGELDLLVHPADNESFGRVVIEAMAAGLPVVGVRGGGVGEIVGDGLTGVLAPPDDAVALAACIDRLVRDGALRARMGAAGRARAESLYSLDACVTGVMGSYQKAMAA